MLLTWTLLQQLPHLDSGIAGASYRKPVWWSSALNADAAGASHLEASASSFHSSVSTAGTSPGRQPVLRESHLDVTYQQPSGANKSNAEGSGIYTSS